jgi:hypothetical protein
MPMFQSFWSESSIRQKCFKTRDNPVMPGQFINKSCQSSLISHRLAHSLVLLCTLVNNDLFDNLIIYFKTCLLLECEYEHGKN